MRSTFELNAIKNAPKYYMQHTFYDSMFVYINITLSLQHRAADVHLHFMIYRTLYTTFYSHVLIQQCTIFIRNINAKNYNASEVSEEEKMLNRSEMQMYSHTLPKKRRFID